MIRYPHKTRRCVNCGGQVSMHGAARVSLCRACYSLKAANNRRQEELLLIAAHMLHRRTDGILERTPLYQAQLDVRAINGAIQRAAKAIKERA